MKSEIGKNNAYGLPILDSSDRGILESMTTDMDLNEGDAVNSMKSTHLEPFPDPVLEVPDDLKRNIIVSSIDSLLNWARKSSVFPLQSGLACCSFEMIGTAMARFDISRFGMEAFRASPRQADLLIVAGTLTGKMAGLAGAHGSVGAVCFLTLYSFVSPQSFFKVIAVYAFLVFLALFFLKPFRVTSPKF